MSERRQEKHTCAYSLSAFLRAKTPGGWTKDSEVSSHCNRRISAFVLVVVLGVLKRAVFWVVFVRQWFASVDGFRAEALQAIQGVEWTPAVGENRITAMTESRSDWCISRQRTWGVPIPVFYDTTSGEPLMNEETIAHIKVRAA